MDLQNTDLPGRYVCTSRSEEMEGGSWTNIDTISIYYDQSQRLSFTFMLETESNHGRSRRREEGFVHWDTSSHEMYFEMRKCHEWSVSWGMGYDGESSHVSTFGPQESLELFRLLNQEELALAREDGIVPDETAIALIRHKGELVYYRDSPNSMHDRDKDS